MVVKVTPNESWKMLEEKDITGVATSEGKVYKVKIMRFPHTPATATVSKTKPNEGIVFLNEEGYPDTKDPIETENPNPDSDFKLELIRTGKNSTTIVIPYNTGWPTGRVVLPQ